MLIADMRGFAGSEACWGRGRRSYSCGMLWFESWLAQIYFCS